MEAKKKGERERERERAANGDFDDDYEVYLQSKRGGNEGEL